jgi:TPR repeat protein
MRARTRRHSVGWAVRVIAALLIAGFVDAGFAGAASLSHRGEVDGVGYLVANARLQALARRGNARAQAMLGFAYATGHGVPQNYRVAVVWYRRAAERGNPTGQYLLGLMYDRGQGVPENKVVAQKWLILAAANATGRARDYYTRIRDAVASTMNVHQIERAQALAYHWARSRRHKITIRCSDCLHDRCRSTPTHADCDSISPN